VRQGSREGKGLYTESTDGRVDGGAKQQGFITIMKFGTSFRGIVIVDDLLAIVEDGRSPNCKKKGEVTPT